MNGLEKLSTKGSIAARKDGRTLHENAYDTLKEMILSAELPPGFLAIEQEISDKLKMSRTPVREALIRLESEGMITIFPRRGFRVSSVSVEDAREIFHVLGALEVAAVEQMTSQEESARHAACILLEGAVKSMGSALDAGDLDAWADADREFHRLLLECCGNGRLMAFADTMWNQAHRVRLITLRLRPLPTGSTKDHGDLVNLIYKGDVDAACELHRTHRKKYMQMLMKLMDDYRLNHV
uniref:GntR family transcriptional regulator n=1 Tax=Pararhizobium sp. IMCC3301 TaxID=3067904 RepID=UPI0027416F1B|nr:GntR family transcriptional regulator [Pararhizobium sp. IMCC3301]